VLAGGGEEPFVWAVGVLPELSRQLDSFRFMVYAELAGIEIGPVR
jgi:hypothetical protein